MYVDKLTRSCRFTDMTTSSGNKAVTVEIGFQNIDIAIDRLVNADGTATQFFWSLWKDDCRGYAAKRMLKQAGLIPSKTAAGWVVSGVSAA